MGIDRVQNGKRFSTTRVRRYGDDVLIEGVFNKQYLNPKP